MQLMQATPALQQTMQIVAMATPQAVVTSVISGPHKGSAHGEGRAVDIAPQFTLGFNEKTWNAIVKLVLSGRVEAIGTEGSIANNDLAKQWCAQHGVALFQDDVTTGATGSHIHIQVPKAKK